MAHIIDILCSCSYTAFTNKCIWSRYYKEFNVLYLVILSCNGVLRMLTVSCSYWNDFFHIYLDRILICICSVVIISWSFIRALTHLWNIFGFHLLASRGPLKTLSGHIWFLVNVSDLNKWMNKVPDLMIKMVSHCLSGMKKIQMNETLQGYLTHIPPPHLKRHLCCSINP